MLGKHKDPRVNWEVVVGPMYGQLADPRFLYYSVSLIRGTGQFWFQVASFGLSWELGDTFFALAIRFTSIACVVL